MDADLLHIIGKYLWLPFIGLVSWFMKTQDSRIKDVDKELTRVKLEYVSREEFIRALDGVEKKLDKQDIKLDKQDGKLDKILERVTDKRS